ncbi:uncharacterized protein LOC144451195 [Glandiceps talaboti]
MSMGVWNAAEDHMMMASFKTDLRSIFHLNKAIEFLQIERCEYGKSVIFDSEAKISHLNACYGCSNSSVEFLSLSSPLYLDDTTFTSQVQLGDYFKYKADQIRQNSSNPSEAIFVYNDAILNLTKQITVAMKRNKQGTIWQTIMSYLMLIKSREQLELERFIGTVYFTNETSLTKKLFLAYSKAISVGMMTFRASERYLSRIDYIQIKCFGDTDCPDTLISMRKSIQVEYMSKTSGFTTFESGLSYLTNLSTMNQIWKNITTQIEQLAANLLDATETSTNSSIILNVVACFVTIIMIPVTLKSILRVINQLQASMSQISQQATLLNMEKRKADILLTQMLPPKVAENLKNRKPVKAEMFDQATILFTDVVDFMKYTSMMEPFNIVRMLNNLYSCFDARIKLYDVYKVETIGEVYMCVSGIPSRNGKRHAGEIASLALHFQRDMNQIEIPGHPELKMELKAGMNTGPVTAGVVGLATPRYCLFGDTVNTASRMESNCLPGKIQITQSTGRLLTELGGFHVTPRGQVEIKGKGLMMTYWLMSRQDYERVSTGKQIVRRRSSTSVLLQ